MKEEDHGRPRSWRLTAREHQDTAFYSSWLRATQDQFQIPVENIQDLTVNAVRGPHLGSHTRHGCPFGMLAKEMVPYQKVMKDSLFDSMIEDKVIAVSEGVLCTDGRRHSTQR